MGNKLKQTASKKPSQGLSERTMYILMMIIVGAVAFGLYVNTVRNYYNLDDYHIAKNNPDFEQGIKAIPKIFTTLYSSQDNKSYGYRPLIRSSFAIEYQFFGKNPYVSHLFNTIF